MEVHYGGAVRAVPGLPLDTLEMGMGGSNSDPGERSIDTTDEPLRRALVHPSLPSPSPKVPLEMVTQTNLADRHVKGKKGIKCSEGN